MTAEPRTEPEIPRAKRPRILRLLLWSLALLGAVLLVAWWVLESDWLSRTARLAVERRAGEALGREVSIGELDFDLFPPSATASDIVVGGVDPSPGGGGLAAPLARVGQLSLELGPGLLRSLRWGGPITIREIRVVEPRVDIRFAEDGSSNLPELPGSDGDGGLEVELRALDVVDGTLLVEERSVPLELAARGVRAGLRRTPEGAHRLSAVSPEVSLRLEAGDPVTLALDLEARVGSGAVRIERAELTGERMDLAISGELARDSLRADLAGRVGVALARDLGVVEAAAGDLELEASVEQVGETWTVTGAWRSAAAEVAGVRLAEADGTVDVEGRAEGEGEGVGAGGTRWALAGDWRARSLRVGEVETSTLTGTFDGRVLTGGGDDRDLRIEGVADAAATNLGDWTVRSARVDFDASATELRAEFRGEDLRGARVDGSATIPLGDPGAGIRVVAEVSELELRRLFDGREPPFVGVAGVLSGTGEYTFRAAEPRQGRGAAELRVAPPSDAGDDLALSGGGDVTIAAGRVLADELILETPDQRVSASGSFDIARLRAELDVAVESGDVAALLNVVPALAETPGAEPWEPSRGRGEADGTVVGDPDGFRFDAELALEEVVLAGASVARAGGTLVLDSGGVQGMDLTLENPEAGSGDPDTARSASEIHPEGAPRLRVHGTVPFGDASASYPAPPLDLEIEARRWRLSDAGPWLPFELPIDGTASGRVTVGGGLEEVRGLVEVSVDGILAGGVELPGTIAGEVAYGPDTVDVRWSRYAAPFGDVELSGTLDPASGRLDLSLVSSPLDLAAPPVDGFVAGDLTGWLDVDGTLVGTVEEPEVDLLLVATGVDLGGHQLGDDGSSRLRITSAGGRVEVDGSVLGLVSVSGGGRWDRAGADVELAVQSDAMAEIFGLGMTEVPEGVTGELAGSVLLRGEPGAVTTRLELARLEVQQGQYRLRNLEPVVVSLDDDGVRIESLYLGREGFDSELFLAGRVAAPGGELDLVLQSSIDASWLHLMFSELDASGRLEVLAKVGGTASAPRLDGQASVAGGQVIVAGFPHAAERVEGLFFLYPDQIVVDSSSAVFARGRLSAEGTMLLEGDLAGQYELRLRGTDLDLRYPEDWRILADGRLTLSSDGRERLLSGTVEVERASYVRDFDIGLTQLLRAMFERRPEVVDETDEFLLETRLNINVQGPDALQVRTDVAVLNGDLDFTVRGSLARPVLLGDVRLDRGGTIELTGTRYTLERGNLIFSNPFRNDPSVDLVATSTLREYEVNLNVFGPVDDLQTSVSSSPPLPSLDVLSLLTTGTTDALDIGGRSGATSDDSSAEEFLAAQAASLAGRRVGELFGLDQVQVTPLTSGTSELSTARFTVGKRISRDLYLTYSNDPSRSDKEIVELRWQLYPSIAVLLTGTDNDTYAVDLRWNKSF